MWNNKLLDGPLTLNLLFRAALLLTLRKKPENKVLGGIFALLNDGLRSPDITHNLLLRTAKPRLSKELFKFYSTLAAVIEGDTEMAELALSPIWQSIQPLRLQGALF